MDRSVLSDPAVFPTHEVLASHLGKAVSSFNLFCEFNHAHFPEFVERWKYYNDGKRWLMNVSRKKKTLFWLSVKDGSFRTTFYLNAQAAKLVPGSNISQELKDQFKKSEGEKFRPITVEIRTKKDVEIYRKMLALKMAAM
jgi:hypothetical protein